MPGGDGTGPAGQGSMTGRGLGYCAGYSSPGFTKGPGMGMAWGWGRGRGRGAWGYGRGMAWGRGGRFRSPAYAPYRAPAPVYSGVPPASMSEEDQLNMLKQEKDYLESEMGNIKNALEDISKRISDLEQK
ncbi:MAG: hypothetical protein GF311_04905 [Candidatus Lokiarchaeota archaeon]|nr:hypothetical protein [Candidatus Lokiarchaeota archaeon]